MKKVVFTIFVMFLLLATPVSAASMNKYSDNSKIISALEVLQTINENDVFTRLDRGSIKIMFYDLSLIDFSYAKHYAVSSTDENGNNFILINSRYQGAPVEAIASLIAHESVHVLPQATLEEEVQATTKEAQTWLKLRNRVSVNASENELVKRENRLALMYQSSGSIKSSIENNSFYKQQ